MRRFCLFLLLAALPLPLRAADAPAKPDGDLYVLGVGLDQEPNKAEHETIDAYNWCPEEVEKLFKEQAASFHRKVESRLVLGEKATHQGILDGLAWLRDNTHKSDLVIMYVGCHGFTDPNEGWGVATADGKTLWGHEIKAGLGKLPCRVILFIETCTSGGFASAAQERSGGPGQRDRACAPAPASRRPTTNSTWRVAEALYGRADFNHDGVVDLDELVRYVRLRYREWWPAPKRGDDHETPVIVQSGETPGSLPLTRTSADLAAVFHGGRWLGAIAEKQGGDRYRVHMLGWANRPRAVFRREFGATRRNLPALRRPAAAGQAGRRVAGGASPEP